MTNTNFDFYTKNKEFRNGVKNCEFADICKGKPCYQYVISNYDNREWCVHPENLKANK